MITKQETLTEDKIVRKYQKKRELPKEASEFITDYKQKYPFERKGLRNNNGVNINVFNYILKVKYKLSPKEIGKAANTGRFNIYKSMDNVQSWIKVKDGPTLKILSEYKL
jgi:hypothetical protein